jgi:ethanolamine utilization protein EutP (predicted NTPase)
MTGLRTYRDRRLELGDMIRAALHVARGCRDQLAEKQARDLLARLATDRFQLAVVGQFSRGKTTLMNALLGGAYLPMGALPMTSVITTVRFGSRPRAIVHRRGSPLPVEVPLAEVADFITQASTRRAELQVLLVQVEIPAEILRLGFEFVDTPGVGSAIEMNTATTRQFLPEADAVIFVTGFDSPLTETEAGFLADATRHAGRLFLVLNKRDLVSDRDAAQAAEFVRRRVREDLAIGESRLFALSALEALEAVVQGDRGRLSGSGLPQLRATLDEFLTTGKTRVILGNIADRAAGLVSGQRRDLRLGRLRLDGGPDPSVVLAAFDARMAELSSQRSAVADKIADRIDGGLPEVLAARSHAWQASLRDLIEPRADDSLAAAGNGTVRSVLGDAAGKLEEAGRDIAGAWLDRRLGEVHELLTGLVAGQIGELLEISRSPGVAGAGIAGLAGVDDRRELAGWSAEDVPALLVPVPEWTVPVRMPRRSRRKASNADAEVRRYLEYALTAAIVAFDERARVAFQEAARDWARRLDDQAGRQMREAADRFRRFLRTVPRDEDLAALDGLAHRLADFKAALDAAELPRLSEAADAELTSVASPPADGCMVCEQMQATLTGYLRRSQFRLATYDGAQERHALAGGFCPLHTWQYAAIASPLGISAGYPKLAAAVADALESISEQDGTVADLASRVAAVAPQPGTCPLCAALAEREGKAVSEAVGQVPAVPAPAPLCLRHLALALAAGPPPDTGRAMVRALADALRRNGEDMRAYALKREALHRGLVTEEESLAYLGALRRLAGLSALTQTWADTDG